MPGIGSIVAPVVGGVAGAIFGGKDKKQTSTQTLDPTVQRYRDSLLRQAQGLSQASPPRYGGPLSVGLSPLVNQAAGVFGDASGFVSGARGVLGGDPAAIAAQINPYQSQVLGGLGQQFNDIRTAMQQQLAEQATRAGAFGGDRYGIALGQAFGDIGKAQAQQSGQLLYQGYGDVLNRAQQNLGLGLGAAGQLGGLGVFGTQLDQQNQQNLYNEFLRQQQLPYQQLAALQSAVGTAGGLGGGSTTQRTPGSGFLGGAIGGALAGQGLFNSFGGGGSSIDPAKIADATQDPSKFGYGFGG